MIEYVAYGILWAIGLHLGGKVADRYRLGPEDKARIRIYNKYAGYKTRSHVARLYTGL